MFNPSEQGTGQTFDKDSMAALGISLLGVGTMMSMASVLLIFRLSPEVGPIHLAMHRCIKVGALFSQFIS